jgi:phosphatidylserine decarboxylase
MTIHKEGFIILTITFVILIILNVALAMLLKSTFILMFLSPASSIFLVFLASFFRKPKRRGFLHDNAIIAPADGTIVAIEEIEDNLILKEKCIQVSIFMSIYNVHINWYPVNGTILESKHQPGRFWAAYLPKSSTDNEHTSILINTNSGKKIVVRQVAGAIARRIVCYAKQNSNIKQGDELGFIKFGSRVDLYLPIESRIDVKKEQKVVGKQTVIGWIE